MPNVWKRMVMLVGERYDVIVACLGKVRTLEVEIEYTM